MGLPLDRRRALTAVPLPKKKNAGMALPPSPMTLNPGLSYMILIHAASPDDPFYLAKALGPLSTLLFALRLIFTQ